MTREGGGGGARNEKRNETRNGILICNRNYDYQPTQPSKANSHYHPHRPYTLPSTSRLIRNAPHPISPPFRGIMNAWDALAALAFGI